MRKQIITVFFMLTWICQLSGRYVTILSFYMNQAYIAENLCVNRDKPQLHCNGKCHLAKKMSEEDRRDQERPDRKMDNSNEVFYTAANEPDFLKPSFTSITHAWLYPYSIGIATDRPSDVFRPPIS